MKVQFFLSLVTLLLISTSCSRNPAENVPAANVTTETNAPAASANASNAESAGAATTQAGERYFTFGPSNSSIEWVGSKVTGSHNGNFQKFSGEFRVVNGKLADSENQVNIEIDSITSDNNRLTGHLKSADFFDVEKYPTAKFVSTSVVQSADNSLITGNLTLHGVTKQISFPATIKITDDAVDVTSEFFLNRFDFDIKYAGKADDLIRKEVVLKLKVHATPGRASTGSEQTGMTNAVSAR